MRIYCDATNIDRRHGVNPTPATPEPCAIAVCTGTGLELASDVKCCYSINHAELLAVDLAVDWMLTWRESGSIIHTDSLAVYQAIKSGTKFHRRQTDWQRFSAMASKVGDRIGALDGVELRIVKGTQNPAHAVVQTVRKRWDPTTPIPLPH